MLSRLRQWYRDLAAQGRLDWWLGNYKDCGCHPLDQERGYFNHPPNAIKVDRYNNYRDATPDESRNTIKEKVRARLFRCEVCGETFEESTGVVVGKVVEFEDGTVLTKGTFDKTATRIGGDGGPHTDPDKE